jgi:glycosyltransferase involved in cell wall biosynthesis
MGGECKESFIQFSFSAMRILFLATYFPRPLNPTIGTWALEHAKAFHRAARLNAEDRRAEIEDSWQVAGSESRVEPDSANCSLKPPATSNPPPVTSFRVISGNPWFPKIAGRLKAGIRVYSDCPKTYPWDGVQVDYLPMLFYPFGKFDGFFNRVGEPILKVGWWSINGRLMKIIREFQPDVVYAHHTVPNGYFALRIYQEMGIPFVVTDHEMGEITACEIFPARKAVYEKVIAAAHKMVSVAGVMLRDMERVFPQARCEVIHNGINLARDLAQEPNVSRAERRVSSADPATTPATSHPLPAKAPVATSQSPPATGSAPSTLDSGHSTPIIILSCGMFYERKNFPGLIQAFNLVAGKYPNVVLRIFGDGPDRLKIEQARFLSPFKDRIELLGKVGHKEVLQQMKTADIFALIGWREPFATVFLEAMAVGLPIIACNDGGIAEVIAGVELPDALDTRPSTLVPPHANGILVPPKDIHAASRALEFLILNPETRKQIGTAASRMIEADLTWEVVTKKYLQIFCETKM